jgi:hypothetical protein
MPDEIIVRLKIISYCQVPQQITNMVGLACDKSWLIGDKRGKTIIVEQNNGWVLNSSLPKSASLEAHVENLLKRLSPYADKIQKFAEHDNVEFSCVIYATTPPALNFSNAVIQKISLLGASLDVDLYLNDGDQQ